MRLQQPTQNTFHSLTTEQLNVMLADKKLVAMHGQVQEALDEKTRTRAYITVEILKSSDINPIGETGMSRVQGKLVSAQLVNPKAGDEVTFGFGDIIETAKIGIFVQIPDEQLESLNVVTSNHVRFEVALSLNAETQTHYILQAGEINELRSTYIPDQGKSRSFQVWKGPEGEEYLGKTPPAGYIAQKLPSYGNVTVIEVLECNPVNLALLNAVIPTDKRAWILQATAAVARNSEINLQAYQQKRAAMAEQAPISNANVEAMAATLANSELEVAI